MADQEKVVRTARERATTQARTYWDVAHLITNAILIFLAGISVYLQYVMYPAILALPPYSEKSIVLHFFPFLYSYDATRCVATINGPVCETIIGVPSIDFFQIFAVATIVWDLFRYYRLASGR